ncbi:MAG: phytoene/squalene synthase family protein [Parvularcula sp.]
MTLRKADTPDDVAKMAAEKIAKGSKSFAIASLLFRPHMKRHAHMLYAWCRYCDDVIDGQNLGFSAQAAPGQIHIPNADDLSQLRAETSAALTGQPVTTPEMVAFQEVALATNMPEQHPFDLLRGFEMDVQQRHYETLNDTLEYCYHVAGVVGVMMAIVMGVDPEDDDTLDRASDLGIAFQLTNICRDIIDDAEIGRVYLPAAWLRDAGIDPSPSQILLPENREVVWSVALRVLAEADKYYQSSAPGVRRLPIRAGFAVSAARRVYRDIGRVVRKRGTDAWNERARTSRRRKLALAGLGCIQSASSKSMMFFPLPPRPDLWTRPAL